MSERERGQGERRRGQGSRAREEVKKGRVTLQDYPKLKTEKIRYTFGVCRMVLSQEEIDGCREAFLAFDKDRSGTIDVWELRQVLEAMGQKPTEEELFQMISEVDENMSGSIDFAEFLKVIENQKERAENFDDESDMIDAFVACGGMQNKSGHVKRETLVRIIKHDFGLTIDIEELINKIDTDGSGEIEFEEFKTLLS